MEPGTIDAQTMRVGNQAAKRRLQAGAHRAGKGHQHQSRSGQNEPGIDLLALDHVAALVRLFETLMGGVF